MDVPTTTSSSNGKKVKILPNQPTPPKPEKKVDKGKGKVETLTPEKKGGKDKRNMAINLISHNQIEKRDRLAMHL